MQCWASVRSRFHSGVGADFRLNCAVLEKPLKGAEKAEQLQNNIKSNESLAGGGSGLSGR